MLAYILLILVLAIVVIAAVIILGIIFGRGETLPPAEDSPTIMEANRKAIEENRYGDVRLEISWRGYSPQQVDSLLEALLAKQAQNPAPQQPAASPSLGSEETEGLASVQPASVQPATAQLAVARSADAPVMERMEEPEASGEPGTSDGIATQSSAQYTAAHEEVNSQESSEGTLLDQDEGTLQGQESPSASQRSDGLPHLG